MNKGDGRDILRQISERFDRPNPLAHGHTPLIGGHLHRINKGCRVGLCVPATHVSLATTGGRYGSFLA